MKRANPATGRESLGEGGPIVVGFEGGLRERAPGALTWGVGALRGPSGSVINALSGAVVPREEACRYVVGGALELLPEPIPMGTGATDVIVLVQNVPSLLSGFHSVQSEGVRQSLQSFDVAGVFVSRLVMAFPTEQSFSSFAGAVAEAYWLSVLGRAKNGTRPERDDPVRDALFSLDHDHPAINAVHVFAKGEAERSVAIARAILCPKDYEEAGEGKGSGEVRLAAFERCLAELRSATGFAAKG